MDELTLKNTKAIFNRADLYTTFNLKSNCLRVEITEGLEVCREEAIALAREEVHRLLKSFKITKESLVVNQGKLVLESFEYSPVELKKLFSTSSLVGLMKATGEGLEINASDFGLPLKNRFRAKKEEALSSFKEALNKAVSKGYLRNDSPIKKEEDVRSGEVFYVISL